MSKPTLDRRTEDFRGEVASDRSDPDPLFQETTREEIELYGREFRLTGNPVHAWRAIQAANLAGLAYPEWVRRYLHACAAEICNLVERPPKRKVAEAIAEAVGLFESGRKGRGSRLSEQSDTAWERHAAMAERCLAQGDQETYAYDRVAEMYGVSAATVRRHHLQLLDFRKSRLSES